MGASSSLQTNVTNVSNTLRNEINQAASASSQVNCSINIGSIRFKSTKGCSIKLSNNCYASAENTMELVSEVLANFYNDLSVSQKQEAVSLLSVSVGISTNVTNAVNDFRNYLTQTCNAEAVNESNITVKDIEITDCTAPEGQQTVMEFINTGKATAICSMRIFNNLIADASTIAATTQSTGIDWSKILWPIALIIIIVSIVYLVVSIVVKKLPSNKEKIELETAKKDNYATRIATLLSVIKNNNE